MSDPWKYDSDKVQPSSTKTEKDKQQKKTNKQKLKKTAQDVVEYECFRDVEAEKECLVTKGNESDTLSVVTTLSPPDLNTPIATPPSPLK